jgi:hypothetical protein
MKDDKDTGLQSKIWDGYFDESKDSIMGSWHRCDICNKIPSEIYNDSRNILTIWHCKKCDPQDYIPKNFIERLFLKIDNCGYFDEPKV